MLVTLKERCIGDFGEQWQRYPDNNGYYASRVLFEDMFQSLLAPEDIAGKRVAEIGSGSGRIVKILMECGAHRVVAVEPSAAYEVLCTNVRRYGERVRPFRLRGDELPAFGDLDLVFAIGVLHHIPEPAPVMAAAYRALRPGGRIGVWLYGKEGNRLYLAVLGPLRVVTRRLPHGLLAALCWLLDWPLFFYMTLCTFLPLPLRGYMRNVMAKLQPGHRRLTIYDQLNPAYAKYYTRDEAERLLSQAGFVDIQVHHRHGYSWSLVGTKPASPMPPVKPLACPLCGAVFQDWFVKQGRRLARCPECGLVSVPDGLVADKNGVSIYESDDNIFLKDGNEAYYLDETNLRSCRVKLDWIRRYLPEGSGLLDVGANYGHFLAVAREFYPAVAGFDLSPQAVRWSRELFGVRNFTASIYDPPQELLGPHEGVTCWDVIEHLPDPLGALASLHRLVAPGGYLFLSTPDAGSVVARLLGRHWHYLDPEQHLYLFSRANLQTALERSGFQVLSFKSFGRYYRLRYVIDRLAHLHGNALFRRSLELAMRAIRPVPKYSVYLHLGDVMGVVARGLGNGKG
jgi:SAM-dependent methyltransferase